MQYDVELMIICLREMLQDALEQDLDKSHAMHFLNSTYFAVCLIEERFDALPAEDSDKIREIFEKLGGAGHNDLQRDSSRPV